MEEFLATLNPSVRERVNDALELDAGEARLHRVVGPYIDEEGNWPTDEQTNDYLARSFLRQSEFAMPSFSSSGLSQVAIGALAGGALSLAGGTGLIVAGSEIVERYWAEMIGYAYGIQPSTLRTIKGVIDFFVDDTDWRSISRQMGNGFKSVRWAEDFSNKYASKLSSVLIGEMADAAWRGTRAAANHLIEPRVSDVSVNQWIGDYVARFARNQADLSKRTAQRIVEDALEHGLNETVMAGRLQQMWALTPHHVDASNRYRRGLQQQDRTAAWVNRMTQRYNNRLLNARLKAISETETLTLFNLGREAQWMRSVKEGILPENTMKMWITGRDEKVCEVCAPMDGELAALGEVFPDVGLYVPAAHPNCRCITIPVQRGVVNMDEADLVFPVRDVSKRIIRVKEHTRSDGTVVEEHDRNIGRNVAIAAGVGALGAAAILTRGGLNRFTIKKVPGKWADLEKQYRAERITRAKSLDHPLGKDLWSEPQIFFTREHWKPLQGKSYKDTISKIDAFIKNKPVEHNFIVDASGTILAGTRGNANAVAALLPRSVRDGAYKLTAVHNHPYSTPISGGDVTMAFMHNMGTIRVVGRDGHVSQLRQFKPKGDFASRHSTRGDLWDTHVAPVLQEQINKTRRLARAADARGETIESFMGRMGRTQNSTFWDVVTNGYRKFARLGDLWEYTELGVIVKRIDSGVTKHLGGPSGELPHKGTGTQQDVHSANVQAPDRSTTQRGGRAGDGPPKRQDSSGPDDRRLFRSGEWDAGDTAASALVGTAAAMVTRGRVRNMQQLTMRMRRLNEIASRPLRDAQTGDIRMMDTRRMDLMTEGTGFRVGNQNHIRQIANNMMRKGYDQSQPVIMAVYRDGSQVLDGMHRAQAARAAGIRQVPVKVIRVDRNMPTPGGFRSQYDAWRQATARSRNIRTAQPRPTDLYTTRNQRAWEQHVNAFFERGGLDSTERFIRDQATPRPKSLSIGARR